MSSERFAIQYEQPKRKSKSYDDSSFVVGDSPATLDVLTDLGALCYVGEIDCDGAGDILIGLSNDGSTFDDNFPLKAGETFVLNGYELNKLKITHSGADSSYRARFFRGLLK
jgi:hypothetical protein